MNAKTHKGIAIVDDETSYTDLLAVTLGECFHNEIHAFTNPRKFLEALPELDLGIVVTDFQMPGMNGLELIKQTRKQRPGLPFLLITGQASLLDGQDVSQISELRGILYKPFSWRKLATEILRAGPVSPRL